MQTVLAVGTNRHNDIILRVFHLNRIHCAPLVIENGNVIHKPHLSLEGSLTIIRNVDNLAQQRDVLAFYRISTTRKFIKNLTAFHKEGCLAGINDKLRTKSQLVAIKSVNKFLFVYFPRYYVN